MTAQQKHTALWNSLEVRKSIISLSGKMLVSDVAGEVDYWVNRIMSSRARYQSISGTFANPIRWYHVAVIHYLECTLNFARYLGNGQSLYQKTTIVPVGRGPFRTFEEGARDAIRLQGLDKQYDWSIGNTLYLLEGYNGYGYSKYRGIESPYLYSGSNHYVAGKYVSDGKYDPVAVSSQIGCALLLKEIFKRLNINP